MEQLPLTFIQATIEPDIQECFDPAYNFTKINSSNGRLAFTTGKVYWLPDNPMALLDQGWVINNSEIAGCEKFGVAGFAIKLTDGKKLRFSNVNKTMREDIMEAIEAHKNDSIPEAAVADAAPSGADAPDSAQAGPATDVAADPADVSSNKLMAILSYFSILVLIPLFAAKESKFARFHVNQGLILLILEFVIFFIGKIPGIFGIAVLLNLCVLVLSIIGIVNAAKGKTKELPLVGKYIIIK